MSKTIIYDFDGTLTPLPLPEFEILEKCGFQKGTINKELLKLVTQKSQEKDIDMYQAYYETFFEVIKNSGYNLTDDNICLGYNRIIYNEYVIEFLEYLKNHHIKNHLLSSGIKEFLNRITIAHLFETITATSFTYNDNNEVNGIAYLMSDKNKVDAIKKINEQDGKTSHNCSDIIYIGDGLTDAYAMEFVKNNGGISIFVYQDENSEDIEKMRNKGIVTFFVKRDFSLKGNLLEIIKNFFNKEC